MKQAPCATVARLNSQHTLTNRDHATIIAEHTAFRNRQYRLINIQFLLKFLNIRELECALVVYYN